ncbi:MAG: hypothetical protein AB9835_00275 [Eubacteriales bacterium]
MYLEKYKPAYGVIAVIVFINLVITSLSELFFIPRFVYIPLCFISSLIGVLLVSAVIPNTEIAARDEKSRFIKSTLIYCFYFACINIAVSFGLSFVFVSVLGGLLLKIGDLYISTNIVSVIGFAIFLVVQWRYLTYTGYQATIKREYNGPLFAIVGAHAVSFQIPMILGEWIHRSALEASFATYNVNIFPSVIPFLRPFIPSILGALGMVLLNMFIIYTFYKKGRGGLLRGTPPQQGLRQGTTGRNI